MIINLDRLDGDTQTVVADEIFPFDDAFGKRKRLRCHTELGIRRMGETYYIQADVTGVFATDCHKCLIETQHEVQSSLALVVQRGGAHGKQDPGSGDDDLILMSKGERELELDQHIYENMVVNIPIQIACSDDCKGLCPGCGVNLNKSECTCAATPDSRWEGLRELRDSLPE